jgi:Na+-driven multidrug efflux pump
VIQNFFQSIGKPHLSIFLSLTRQLLFLIPCLLILPPVLKVDGVWLAMAASDLLAILTAVVTLCVMLRRINKRFYATATSIESAA